MDKKKIIVVDDNASNLNICKKALKELYEVYPAPSAEKMFEILTHIIPELILLDVEMPGIHGHEAMRMLRADNNYKMIPVIFLTAMDDAQSEMEGLDLGAVDYIHKPFVSSLLIKRIETHIALIEGRKEMLTLNKSIENLLTPLSGSTKMLQIGAEQEAIKDLLKKARYLSRTGHELRAPLNIVIEMIGSAIQSDDIKEIRQCLGKADIESRLMVEILDDVLDIQVSG
jgi:DNA-binding response OmpR family regulator